MNSAVREWACRTDAIDENGIIVRAFDKVKAAENPAQMLDALK